MSLYTVQSEKNDTMGIITLTGYINENAGKEMITICEDFLNNDEKMIVLDMSGVHLINSMGIASIIHILNRIMEHQGKLFVVTPSEIIKKTLQLMGLEKYLKITDNLAEVTRTAASD